MLGVEIGEEFKVRNNNEYVYMFDELLLYRRFIGQPFSVDYVGFNQLLNRELVIQKLPKKPKLTEVERVILGALDKEWTWIARDKGNSLYLFASKPERDLKYNMWCLFRRNQSFSEFRHIFPFIKWEDEEPYNIKVLLEEYEKGKK